MMWLDLRFDGSAREEAYRASLEQALLRSTLLGSCAVVLALLTYVAADLTAEFSGAAPAVAGPRRALATITALPLAWHLLLVALTAQRVARPPQAVPLRATGDGRWEAIALVTYSADAVLLGASNKSVLAAAHGVETARAFASASQSAHLNGFMLLVLLLSWSSSFSGIRCHRAWAIPVASAAAAIGLAATGGGAWPALLLGMVATCLFSASWQSERRHRRCWQPSEAAVNIEEPSHRSKCETAMQLLASVCDCVLVLDDKLCLLEPAYTLSGLLRRPQLTVPAGVSLKEVMSPIEFCRVQEAIEQGGCSPRACAGDKLSPNMAASLTVQLRGSLGNPVPVHMYFATSREPQGPRHMIGMVEVAQVRSDGESCAIAVLEAPTASGIDDSLSRSISERAGGNLWLEAPIVADDVQSCDEPSMSDLILEEAFDASPPAESRSYSSGIASLGPVTAQLRLAPASATIEGRSAAFDDLFGAAAGRRDARSLSTYFVDAEVVKQWLLRHHRDVVSGAACLAPMDFGVVSVRTPLTRASDPGFPAMMFLSIASPVRDGDCCVATLLLTELTRTSPGDRAVRGLAVAPAPAVCAEMWPVLPSCLTE